MTIVLAGGAAALSILFAFLGLRQLRAPGYDAQLEGPLLPGPAGRAATIYSGLIRPLALRLGSAIGPLTNRADIGRQLEYAGLATISPDELCGLQGVGVLGGLLGGMAWLVVGLPLGPIALVTGPLIGFFAPRLWLAGRVRRRQEAISRALPDLLDMLAACVSAGLGLDIALGMLVERGEGPLYEELGRLLRELRVGEPRPGALRRLVARNSSEPLRRLADALLQADDLGTPIARALEGLADDMRVFRRNRARERGAQAATKISLTVVFGVLPSVMCLILGALVMSIFTNAGPLFSIQP